MNNLIKNNRKIFINSDGYLTAAISILQNNVYKVTYYEIISGASGTLTIPTGGTINAGEFSGANCVLSEIDGSNKPTFVTPLTGGGSPVTATLNVGTGAWLKSGVTASTNVALIYSVNITAADYQNLNNFYIIDNVLLSSLTQVLNNSALNSTPSSLLAGIISDETGTGSLVFNTNPQFLTSVNIGNAVTTNQRVLRIGQDTAWIDIGSQSGATARPAIYFNVTTPDTTNFIISSHQTTGDSYFNGKTSARFLANGNIVMSMFANYMTFAPSFASSGAVTTFEFTVPNHTAQTASTNIPNFKVNGGIKSWSPGTTANQYWNYFTSPTASGASSTLTNSFTLFVEAATVGTASITNNYAAGFAGNIHLATTNTAVYGNDSGGTARKLLEFTSGDNINIYGRQGTTDIVLDPTSSSRYLIIKSGGSVGIYGVASPSANLHIGAASGTGSGRAPLKFTSGTVMATAETAAMEYNNTFHLTNSDAVRRHVVLAPNTTKVTAAAPYANDGYIIINIGGTDFKVMTTA